MISHSIVTAGASRLCGIGCRVQVQTAVAAIGKARGVPLPLEDLVVEGKQCWNLDMIRDGHIVLHSVQAAQHQVEHADRVPQGVGQLLDDHCKAVHAQYPSYEAL
jgi:hypothetical protein